MRKKIIAVFMIVNIAFFNLTYGNEQNFELTSKSAILIEQNTGSVLYEKNVHEKLAPASVTKIMTLLLIYEGVAKGNFNWDDLVTISKNAQDMGGSQVYLEEGETQKVSELTKAIIISSANDGAVAMSEFISGSESEFVELMNTRAKELGMENTVFKNPCGLDTDGHFTTAYDISLMSRELMKNFPEITEYTTTRLDKIVHNTKRGVEETGLTNTNKLITSYNGITGLKTGYTSNALFCLSATAKRDDLEFIAVILGNESSENRFDEAVLLLDYGFNNFNVESGYNIGKVMGQVLVDRGKMEVVEAVVKDEINIVVPKDNNQDLEINVDIISSVKSPVEAGVKVGEITYLLSGNEMGKVDLITKSSIEKADLHIILERLIKIWW